MDRDAKQLLRIAIEKCTIKIEQKEDVYHTLIKRGILWEMARNYGRSIQDLSQAIGLKPTDAEPYILRAYSFLGMDNIQEALKDFSQAKQMNIEIERLTEQDKSRLVERIKRKREILLKKLEQKLLFEQTQKNIQSS